MRCFLMILTVIMLGSCGSPAAQTRSVCLKNPNNKQSNLNIEGGSETSEYPGVIFIFSERSEGISTCTGSIVGHNVVLTAAHCLSKSSMYALPSISRWGANMLASSKKTAFTPKDIITHGTIMPEAGNTPANLRQDDLAIFIFADNTFQHKDITVPSLYKVPRPNQLTETIMVGYGRASENDSSETGIKRVGFGSYVFSEAMPQGVIVTFDRLLDPQTLEATGPVKFAKVWQGDSGGPLLVKKGNQYEIIGIASGGGSSPSGYSAAYADLYSARSIGLLNKAVSRGAKFTATPQLAGTSSNAEKPSSKPTTNCLN